MSIKEEQQILEEKKLVGIELMKWGTFAYAYWNPQDPNKATCKEWQDIYNKLNENNLMTDYLNVLYFMREINIDSDLNRYSYFLSVNVLKKWQALIETLKEKM